MLATPAFVLEPTDSVVRTAAFSLGGGDQQVVSLRGQSAGIPISRNEAQSLLRKRENDSRPCECRRVKHCNRIQRGIRHEQPRTVGRLGQSAGISPGVLL